MIGKPLPSLSTPRRHGPWWHVAWALPLVGIQLFYVFGLLAEGGYNDYTKTYSIVEAIEMTSKVPLSHAFKTNQVLFIPWSLVCVVIASVALRLPLTRTSVFGIGVARLLLSVAVPFLFTSPTVLVGAPLVGPLITWEMLHGTTGETYAESMPVYAAFGWWMWYQVVLIVRGVRDRERRQGRRCSACGYSLDGLGVGAVCPECGKA